VGEAPQNRGCSTDPPYDYADAPADAYLRITGADALTARTACDLKQKFGAGQVQVGLEITGRLSCMNCKPSTQVAATAISMCPGLIFFKEKTVAFGNTNFFCIS
jgi:hypothetical protein